MWGWGVVLLISIHHSPFLSNDSHPKLQQFKVIYISGIFSIWRKLSNYLHDTKIMNISPKQHFFCETVKYMFCLYSFLILFNTSMLQVTEGLQTCTCTISWTPNVFFFFFALVRCQYVFHKRTWIEYWPTATECRTEHESTCAEMEQLKVLLSFQCVP